MRVLIEKGNYCYKDLVGQEFDVTEKFDSLYSGLYFIKGRENEHNGNWFSKSDCKILDKDYLKALEMLRINERLEYYNNELKETKEKIKSYESGEHKEEFKGQNDCLSIGAICEEYKLEGKIGILKSLLGIKPL